MKVEIWSDVRCPFCYIGKRKFEEALEQFEHKNQVEVEWKSFELDPNFVTDTSANAYDYLAKVKGQSREWAEQMHEHVIKMAKEVGLEYNFDNAIMANSFNAHRLIQLAKTKGLGDAAEEALFKAHFTEGKNIDDIPALHEIGRKIGLDEKLLTQTLNSDAFTEDVKNDVYQAQNIGVRGVPFFLLDDYLAVSGAQPTETFLGALKQAWEKKEG